LKWFRARQNNQGHYIEFSGGGPGGRNNIGTPLISGRISTQRFPNNSDAQGRFLLKANLSINPTRFARHQAFKLREAIFADEPLIENYALLQSKDIETVDSLTGERSLDGKDNVILGRRMRSVTEPDYWMRIIHSYWGNILRFLERSFNAACAIDSSVRRYSEWKINIQTVETYWEFWSEDAVAALYQVLPSLRVFGSSNRVSTYPLHEEERDGNSPSISIQLTGSISAKLYAKTNKRIRVEIKHDLKEDARVFDNNRHTSANVEQLFYWLEQCASDAAIRGQDILDYISTNHWENIEQRSLYSFLARVVAACEDEAQYELVLSLLVNNSTIHLRQNDPIGSVLRALKRQNVLQTPNRNGRTYSVHPRYREAVNRLREKQLVCIKQIAAKFVLL